MSALTCYISDVLLTENNMAMEHIIPNALGGFLKSPHLITKEVNNTLFAEVDAILVEHIELAQLIEFKRDRNAQPTIIGTSEDGKKYSVNAKGQGTLLPQKPQEIIDENGEKKIKILFSQKSEYFRALKRKNPKLSEKEFESSMKTVFEDIHQPLFFKHSLNIFLTPQPFRGIAKIATNFAVFHNVSKVCFTDFISFIKSNTEVLNRIQLGYFYPKSLLKYDIDDSEVSHILYLKGCPIKGVLFCYIELFNTHCFIVNLSYRYNSVPLEERYIWDVRTSKELKKAISLDLDYQFLSNRSYLFDENSEKDYKERLLRLEKICKLKLTRKAIR